MTNQFPIDPIEYTKPIEYGPDLDEKGFNSFPQRQHMEVAWQKVFHERLPRSYWHPRDFSEKFLSAVPIGQRSKYRTSKHPNTTCPEGPPVAMGLFFLVLGRLLRI